MVKNFLFIFVLVFIFILPNVFAYTNKAEVVVVEAPLFQLPNIESKVVQHLYKGNDVYLHPAEVFKDPYAGDINLDEELAEKQLSEMKKNEKDPMFIAAPAYEPDRKSIFYKTSDKLGNDAYILKEHVHIFYKDRREFEQKLPKPDPTDYVLNEPLPEGYPLKVIGGYRAYLAFSYGPDTRAGYPYSDKISDQSLETNSSIDIAWSKYVPWDDTSSIFFGIFFSIKTARSTYRLNSSTYETVETRETNQQILIGPRLEYDIWKAQHYRLNLNTSLLFTLSDTKEIEFEAKDVSEVKKAEFTTKSFVPTLGFNLQRLHVLNFFDLVVGANVFFNLPKDYTKSDGPNSNYEVEVSNHSTSFQPEMQYFIAFQKSI